MYVAKRRANPIVRTSGSSASSTQVSSAAGMPRLRLDFSNRWRASITSRSRSWRLTDQTSTDGVWSTTRFVEIDDLRHDMHVNIVNFQPGGTIPFPETHVMEHGLYVLEGKAVYLLNTDWVEVEAGDFMWLRAFCPQACYAGGPGRFRYLLYKDVNRHPRLRPYGG